MTSGTTCSRSPALSACIDDLKRQGRTAGVDPAAQAHPASGAVVARCSRRLGEPLDRPAPGPQRLGN